MSGKRVRRRNGMKERFWRRAVAQHQRSGLTIREFCVRRSVSEPLFYARGGGSWPCETAGPGKRLRLAAAEANATPRFVSLKLAAEPATTAMIEIVTRGGHTLCVPPGVDRQTLADVWAVLESQPC